MDRGFIGWYSANGCRWGCVSDGLQPCDGGMGQVVRVLRPSGTVLLQFLGGGQVTAKSDADTTDRGSEVS